MVKNWCLRRDGDEEGPLWTGRRFSGDRRKALLYQSFNDAGFATQQILRRWYSDKKVTRYAAPITVALHSDSPDRAELMRWLARASLLHLDTTTHGNGPGDGLALVEIEWGRIQEIEDL